MSIKPIVKVTALLSPREVRHFCEQEDDRNNPTETFLRKFSYTQGSGLELPTRDPFPLGKRDNPFLREADWTEPNIEPKDYYDCSISSDGIVSFKKHGRSRRTGWQRENSFLSVRGPGIDYEYLQNTRGHPLIVDPFAAVLAVYSPEIGNTEEVTRKHFESHYQANVNILNYISRAGTSDNRLKNLIGLAVMMDTASRTPERMSPELIESMMDWYAANSNGAKLWIGTGTEHIRNPDQRVVEAIKQGKIEEEEYIDKRTRQIANVHELNTKYGLTDTAHPIIFPVGMQQGLDEYTNIRITEKLLAIAKEGVLHKLGSPFNRSTDWLTTNIVRALAHKAIGTKTSDPRFLKQFEDYEAITTAGGSLYTGDDRNFGLVWLWAAMQQLEKHKSGKLDKVYSRNGYHFIRDLNSNALLGYIGLNPTQTICAITELTKWYYAKIENREGDADKHLENYLEIVIPAMGMSTYAFFSRYNKTPAYTDYVRLAHLFRGVYIGDGRPLPGDPISDKPPHRRSRYLDNSDIQKAINGQFLIWQVLAGSITPNQAKHFIESHGVMFNLAA